MTKQPPPPPAPPWPPPPPRLILATIGPFLLGTPSRRGENSGDRYPAE
ncbi:hypothetical protein [Nocardia cyriacigeorgica]|nr:hypothetical protein [Nocardia cyriacigeorgica]